MALQYLLEHSCKRTTEDAVLNVEELIPPEPITAYLYEIDNHFHLEPLREMLRDQKVVGFIAMDSKEASFGVLNGEKFELLENITSGIPGKSGKGGSSQRRYERERDMAVTYFFHRVAEHAAKAFLENHEVTALIIGGPGQTKEDFSKGDFLHYELKNRCWALLIRNLLAEKVYERCLKNQLRRGRICVRLRRRLSCSVFWQCWASRTIWLLTV